uniref:Uncharacterized protein n=1 Tax=Arundo donax TaxID=35708 RepID=A0A0A9BY91_ARUDO
MIRLVRGLTFCCPTATILSAEQANSYHTRIIHSNA